jgi:hypothetical protein
VVGAQPLAHLVEPVDLGAPVGVDDRLLAGLMRLPVGDEGAVAVIAAVEGADALVLAVGGDRGLDVAGAGWVLTTAVVAALTGLLKRD